MTLLDLVNAIRQYQLSDDERVQLFGMAMLLLFVLGYIYIALRTGKE